MNSRARAIVALLIVAAVIVVRRPAAPPPSPSPAAPPPASTPASVTTAGGSFAEAWRGRRADVELETGGRVVRLLADDREGSRHQRFLVRINGEVTVLVAHNLDLAPRVPVAAGDSVELRGEYVWNDRGGVMHWTHRDPAGRHQAGWVRVGGRAYQ